MNSFNNNKKTVLLLNRISLTLCLVLFSIFVANVLLGKAKLAFELTAIPVFSDVVEYLLLMATALFFAISALMKERMSLLEDNNGSGSGQGRRKPSDGLVTPQQ